MCGVSRKAKSRYSEGKILNHSCSKKNWNIISSDRNSVVSEKGAILPISIQKILSGGLTSLNPSPFKNSPSSSVQNASRGNVTGNGLHGNSIEEAGRSSISLTKEKSGYQSKRHCYPQTIKFLRFCPK